MSGRLFPVAVLWAVVAVACSEAGSPAAAGNPGSARVYNTDAGLPVGILA